MRLVHATRLLSKVAIMARRGRVPKVLPPNYFTQVTPQYAEIWFPTAGCTWDAIGHCTTCNYGIAGPVPEEQMYSAVASALERLAPTTTMVWVSAFNTLFEREVPAGARRAIFAAIARTNVKVVVTETHPASVRREIVRECASVLDGRMFGVELGAETMDEFVRYACLNKPFTNELLRRAIAAVHEGGGVVYTNLLAGLPFLSEAEVIADMSRSIADAVAMGCQEVVLFPNHVKDHTVASLLAGAGRYEPPDLWTMQAIIRNTPSELWPRVNFGWLDLKDHPGAARVTNEPDRAGAEALHHLLVTFNNERDLDAAAGAARLATPRVVGRPAETSLPDRILDGYRWLADTYVGAGWWDEFGHVTADEIHSAYRLSALSAS
jgi:radical SAM enzyme (TIGR01210 family)